MSYCRFTDGDVYAYETDGGVQFWVSSDNKALDRLCNTYDEAYRYVKELRDVHGLDVPSYAIEALKEDALEEAKRISGASGVIGELQDENDKLRRLLSNALIVAGFDGRQYLDAYLRDEEGTTLWDELREVGIVAGEDE